jgi:hypothetical protein
MAVAWPKCMVLGQSVRLKVDAKRVLDKRFKQNVGTAVEVRPTVSRANNPFDIFKLTGPAGRVRTAEAS